MLQRKIRVGLVKAHAEWGNPRQNLAMLRDLVLPLAGRGLDVVVTPECFLDGYMVRENCTPAKLRRRCVSGPSDPMIRRVRQLARKVSVNMIFGASELGRDGGMRNVAYLIDRDGGVRGRYCKIMVNRRFHVPGEDLPVFDADCARVGIVICADRRWPEHIRCLRIKGAEVVFNPTWGMCRGFNDHLMQVRAYENGIPVCFAHPSQALICMPNGAIEAMLDSNVPSVLIHDVDLARNVAIVAGDNRSSSPPICNRQPRLYGELAQEG
jgi:N-carbamoylputrescine amidase